MYGKIFNSIYEGTLYGHWEALVTMQQLIVLASPDGIVDMTPKAIAARTGIPLEIIEKGLKVLSDPDPYTRTPGEEGRRILLIDSHRPWGWLLVNHEKYKNMRDLHAVRAQTRERVRKHRESKRDVTDVTRGNAKKRHSDSDSDSDSKTPLGGKDAPLPPGFQKFWASWPKHPRKDARGECLKIWEKKMCEPIADTIVRHVEFLRGSEWRRDGGEYIPAPLVYLRKARWEGADTSKTSAQIGGLVV